MSEEIKKENPKKGMMEVLSTKPIRLSRGNPIQAVNLMLPPGISTFYVKRIDKNHICFIVPVKEIQRLTKKSAKLKEAVEGKKPEAEKTETEKSAILN